MESLNGPGAVGGARDEAGQQPAAGRLPIAGAAAGALGAVLFCVAIWVLHHELRQVHLRDVLHEFSVLPPFAILAAVGCTMVSFLAISGYDMLALRYLGRSLPYRMVAPVSLTATAIGQSVGLALISGGAIRYRMYSALGLGALEIASLIGFVSLTFGAGVTFVAGCIFVFQTAQASAILGLDSSLVTGLGVVLLLPVAVQIAAGLLHSPTLRLARRTLVVPAISITLRQLALAIVDLVAAAGVLYMLVPTAAGLSFPTVLCVFVIAVVVSVISHVPGGIGVFETVFIVALPAIPRAELLSAILAYRAIYYLVPLALAVLAVAVHEFRRLRASALGRSLEQAHSVLTATVPQILAGVMFVSGALLVFSGATPAILARSVALARWVPLSLMEVSHLAGSLIGLGLMFLARGLQRRSALAFRLTAGALLVGAGASLARGFDWEQALMLVTLFAVLIVARGEFRRASKISVLALNANWWFAIAIVIAGSLWLVSFAYKHVEYADALWWQFALDGNAPRSLRASLALVLVVSTLALARLFRPLSPAPATAGAAELERALPLVKNSPDAAAQLALLGDKRLLFDAEDRALLMYQIQGRSWIAMGGPIGEAGAGEDLAWDFVELAENHAGRAVFYQVPGEDLHTYIDMGLATFKLGEEACVDLRSFSLDGKARADLRQARRRAERDGASFEIVPAAGVPALLPELRRISDAWLEDKHTREKGFALGRFDEAYLSRAPCAVVRVNAQVVAFANLWTSGDRQELSIDLMRHTSVAPKGVMDYLFVELMLWGAQNGYRQFSLGMAPLSGLEDHPMAPVWHRLGTAVFRHGEHFYNFAGLRAYKDKFDPEWRPRYLVTRGGVSLPLVLLDVSALIAGGLTGIVKR